MKRDLLKVIAIAGVVAAPTMSAPADTITSLSDNFSGTSVDTTKWNVTNRGLENTGDAGYNAPSISGGVLTLGGTANQSYWYGTSLETVGTFSSSLSYEITVDRVSLSGSGGPFRSSLWIAQDNGEFLQFAQDVGEQGWQFNHTSGGQGVNISAFDSLDNDTGFHEMKLVYSPSGDHEATIDMYLDGTLGASEYFYNWDNDVDFRVILTGQARNADGSVDAKFSNPQVTPVPEPGTLGLLGLGFVVGGAFILRRKRN
jgi:PEP-CTERM motif